MFLKKNSRKAFNEGDGSKTNDNSKIKSDVDICAAHIHSLLPIALEATYMNLKRGIVFQVASLLLISGQVYAMSDMEIRDKWSKSIAAVKKQECKNESKSLKQHLDMAAALIFHGEYGDARNALKKAGNEAKIKACKSAISAIE
ncbi:MAG: hypothetical protein ACE5EN_06895 [Nitrospinota bacterium]